MRTPLSAVVLTVIVLAIAPGPPRAQESPTSSSAADSASQSPSPATATDSASPAPTAPKLNPEAQKEYNAGERSLEGGNPEAALEHFKKANKLAGEKCPECLAGEAKALAMSSDTKAALKAADKMDLLAQNDADRATVHAVRGYVYAADRKKLKQAEEEYRQAVALAPDDADDHLQLGITLMQELQDDEGKQEAARYLALAPNGHYATYAKQIEVDPRRARNNFAPEFSLPTLGGATVSLNQLAGRYVVLDFWATWCGPCREAIGDLKDLAKKYSPEEVTLISVSADKDDAVWKSFVMEKKMTWPQYRDASGDVLRAYSVHVFPTFVVIGPDGIIRDRLVGEDPQDSVVHRVKSSIETLTAQKR